MTDNVVTYTRAVRELDESIDRTADEAREWLTCECGLDGDDLHAAMQKVRAGLAQMRERGLASIDEIFAMVEAAEETKH
jgi:hypothetical protein